MERKHRKPSEYYLEEKLLFHFIHYNKKLYNAGSSKPEHKKTMRLFIYPILLNASLLQQCLLFYIKAMSF